MARMTYTEAIDALAYLDSIGVTGGEEFDKRVKEIGESLGDPNFMEKLDYGTLWDRQRAIEYDAMLEEQRELEARKKKQELQKIKEVAKDGPMYGNTISQAEWDKIRSMYGSTPATKAELEKVKTRSLYGSGPITQAEWDRIRSMYGSSN